MVVASAVLVYAADLAPVDDFEVVSKAVLSDGVSRVSWGEGALVCSDPLFANPQGYAKTYTYAGTAYRIGASVSVTDSDGNTYSSAETLELGASEAISATIVSKISKCTFTGYHRIKDKSDSNWQSGTSTVSY